MSKRRVTGFAIFVIVLIGIGLLAGQIVNAKEKGRINRILGVGGDATVSGTVVDDSGHGWPLYARIDIEGFAGSPVFTDPVTGQYTVNLDSTVTYTLDVTAVSGGYVAESREITPPSGSSTEDFSLEIEQAACNAPGYSIGGGTLYDFDAGQPGDWTVINNEPSQTVTWRFDDPCGRGNLTGGANGFAIIDSDCDDSDVGTEDAELRSPSFDFSGQSNVLLSFDTDFNWFSGGLDEKGDVDVSTDGGSTWENVLRYQGGDFLGPRHEALDISAIAGGQADVMIRFHYYDSDFEFWWQVDNVIIGDQCNVNPGGLLVGNVFDENSSLGVNGATVSSDTVPTDTTSSFGTPDDPNEDDGLYILFSSLTGANDFTASKSGYGSDTHTVAVVADAIVEQDFSMGAGVIDPDPDSLEATVELGTTDSVTLTLNNTGSADADFEIQEGDGLPTGDLRNGRGAPLVRIAGNYSPLRAGLDPNVAKIGKRGIKEKEKTAGDKKRKADGSKKKNSPLDPPWTDVADYPVNIMDNAVVAIDGLVYSVGGFDGGSNLNSGYVYDPGSDTWSPIADMTGFREKPVGVAIDGLIYVTGGWDNIGIPDPTLEIYDPSSDTWTSGASIPTAYAASAGVNLDGLLYAIGGCNDSCGFTDVQVYDPSADSWSTAADYPEETSWLSCGAINGLIYCAGGVGPNGDSASTFVYDSSSDTWSPLAEMPQTQWGAGFVASGGKLYVSGGIGGGAVTNAGFVYDPASDTWAPIENSNNTTYRAGSACGFYRLGGALGFFDPIPDVELYPGITDCDSVDIPWLSEDPTEGTVPQGGSVPVAVTFDTTVLNQPGDYFAHLKIKENTPTDVPDVGVTLHVPLPAGWGWIEGTINGLGRCDDPSGPIEGATVFIDTAGVDWPLQTDSNGFYKVAFLASDSPVTITVSAPNYVGQSLPGVLITAGNTTVQDFTLRLDAPCGNKTPTSFDVTLNAGGTATETLTLSNNGAGPLNFEVFETTFDLPPQVNAPKKTPVPKRAKKTERVSKPSQTHPRSMFSRPAPVQAALDPSATATWFFGAPIPVGTVRYAHARCDTQPNYFYIISGFDTSFTYTDASWRYDAEANAWTELAPYPTASEGATATCYQGRIFVMGGFDDSFAPTDTMFIYDIATDSWSTGATLPRTVWGASAGAWDGKVVLIGGDNFGVTDEVNIYDIATDTWTATGASMPSAAQLPGYFQTANYVYLVGGWDENSPTTNVAATQRYDIVTDTWESGPTLNFPRADLALAATDTSLYSIGGDEDGGSFFDAIGTVERLDLTAWPAGTWEDTGDPIPVAVSSNNGGFCTEVIHVFGSTGEFWSVGGGDAFGNILGNNAFRPNDEHCFSIFSDVPWLEVTMPTSLTGSVPPDSSLALNVNFNAAGLAPGDYTASIVIVTNDPGAAQFVIPVTLHVSAALFNDDFNDSVLDPNWTYKKTWTEAGGVLTLTTNIKKGSAIATPIFAGCQNCGISTSVSTSGGLGNRVMIYGWYVSQNTFIELVLRDDTNKASIRQRSGGSLVKRQNASLTIEPNTFYTVTMTYDGTNIVVNVDGTDLMTFTPQGSLGTGTVGFAVKSGTGSFDFITVN